MLTFLIRNVTRTAIVAIGAFLVLAVAFIPFAAFAAAGVAITFALTGGLVVSAFERRRNRWSVANF